MLLAPTISSIFHTLQLNYHAKVAKIVVMGTFKILKNGMIIADACNVVRGESAWYEFCAESRKLKRRIHRWIPFTFRGYELKLYYTRGDGTYFGVPVETGILVKVKYKDAIALITAPANEKAKQRVHHGSELLARLEAVMKE